MVSVSGTKNEKDGNESLVFGHKLSSVGPGNVSGNNMVYEPNNIDLAMKLHYLKLIYFIDNEATQGITLRKIKECVFSLFNYYYESCGRFRRSENGRPYIKCNDCGARFLEAKTEKTIQEWLQMAEKDVSVQRLLFPDHHVLGPELTYSPPVFLQITFFKCGGISLGISWAHVLGDAFSVSNLMNTLAQFMNGEQPSHPPSPKTSPTPFHKPVKAVSSSPLSIKDVGPIGDLWTIPTRCEMDTYSFHVTQTRLTQLQTKLSTPIQPPFEALCAVIWQAIAKVTTGPKPDVVTVVKKDHACPIEDEMALRNNQAVSSIKADFPVEEAHPKDLAMLIRDWAQDERAQIGEMVDRDPAGSDFTVYGSKLTFVDLEEACFYGFKIKGISPRLVNCFVDGVGEDGVVLVLPGPQNEYGEDEGRIVTLTLSKSYMADLKEELNKEWDLIA
ncbi:protein ECERIFERUM 26-like [Silene latifolia]|uniref:protein ECERIFERUM 26-like n=1 Tax=Silene latifolia TaxID=37657 RepID=UPI003D788425